MKLTKDEQMLVLLYGDGTKSGLEKALIDMGKPCSRMKQS